MIPFRSPRTRRNKKKDRNETKLHTFPIKPTGTIIAALLTYNLWKVRERVKLERGTIGVEKQLLPPSAGFRVIGK